MTRVISPNFRLRPVKNSQSKRTLDPFQKWLKNPWTSNFGVQSDFALVILNGSQGSVQKFSWTKLICHLIQGRNINFIFLKLRSFRWQLEKNNTNIFGCVIVISRYYYPRNWKNLHWLPCRMTTFGRGGSELLNFHNFSKINIFSSATLYARNFVVKR